MKASILPFGQKAQNDRVHFKRRRDEVASAQLWGAGPRGAAPRCYLLLRGFGASYSELLCLGLLGGD